MNQPVLFDVPKDTQSLKARINAFKAANKIWTHSCGANIGIPDKWDAMLLPKNPHSIAIPYQDCFKSNHPVEIIAGYCRVLEEAGFLVNGVTEREAIRLLCENVGIPCDL